MLGLWGLTVLFLKVDLAAQPQFAGQVARVAVGSFDAVVVVYGLTGAADIGDILTAARRAFVCGMVVGERRGRPC